MSTMRKNARRKRIWVALVLVLILAVFMFGAYSYMQIKAQLNRASALKADIKTIPQCLLVQDLDGAQAALDDYDVQVREIGEALNKPFWRMAEKVPSVGSNVTTVGSATKLLEAASEKVIKPVLEQLRSHPLVTEDKSVGAVAQTTEDYMQFMLKILPEAKNIITSANELELGLLDRDGKISAYLVAADYAVRALETSADGIVRPLLQQMQNDPLSEFIPRKLLNYPFLSGYAKVLDDALSVMKDVLADVREKGLAESNADKLDTVESLVNLGEDVSKNLLQPLCQQLKLYPVESVKAGDGFNTVVIMKYIDFAESIMPSAERILSDIQAADIKMLTDNEKVSHYLQMANDLVSLYHDCSEMLDFIRVFIGNGENKLYLLAAQNSAETRATGGYPGAMGTIRIEDGVLTIGDFASVNDQLAVYAPTTANITHDEYSLFLGPINVCRDACFCPDFERAAFIWSLGYEAKNGTELDGVISMTPSIIQKLLQPSGQIELSDGTVLTSQNATKILQRDMYFRYFGRGVAAWSANNVVDALFAETAKKVMHSVVSDLNASKLLGYPDMVRESFAERTMMVWMKDEKAQSLVRQLGWSGGLNADPESPAVGVYFSNILACKMGWFLGLDTDIGEGVANKDGSVTYPVTVSISNTISDEEISAAGVEYILGGDGRIRGALHFFAPAGGTIGDFGGSGFVPIIMYDYHDLQVGYLRTVDIVPGATVQVTFKVTTAPGVDTPLAISQTPTLQGYH